MSEPYDDDPLALEWDRPGWTNRLTWALVGAVVAALTFSAGLLIERQHDTTILATARSGTRAGGNGGLAAGGFGAGRGGGTRGAGVVSGSGGAAAGSGGVDAGGTSITSRTTGG